MVMHLVIWSDAGMFLESFSWISKTKLQPEVFGTRIWIPVPNPKLRQIQNQNQIRDRDSDLILNKTKSNTETQIWL